MRGWTGLFRTSVGLGARHLVRHGYLREAVIRVVIPMDPSRYLELPWALERLSAARGSSLLDLGSPKLLAVALARRGVAVTTVDQLESEVASWRRLTAGEPGLELRVADGRALPFADASFDHATSISVLEHVAGERGDERALAELARCARPRGTILVTLPYASRARTEYRAQAAYVDSGERDDAGRVFFQRWYDDAEVARLVGSVPGVQLVESSVVGLRPDLNGLYTRTFPLLVPAGWLFGLVARERRGPGGDVVRLVLRRLPAESSP
jgi:SAM-dependent methyltransferase